KVVPILNKEGNIIGIVRDIDLLSKVVEKKFGKLNVLEFATTDMITLSKEDSIGKALAIFRENNISRSPILDNGKVMGIVTMHDIVTKFIIPRERVSKGEFKGEKIHPITIPIKEIMTSPVIYVGLEGNTRKVIELMKTHNISDVLIIENNKLFGIITKKDLIEAYVKFTEVKKGFLVQFAGDYELIDEFDRLKILRDINNFATKLERILGSGSIVLHFKKLRSVKGRRYLVRMRLLSPNKTYHVRYEGFNALDIVQILLDKMERIIISDKEEKDDKRWRDYFIDRMWL
ncbi:MAG TPA: CBS domain-containing protein, partial [Candidatus Aenigmarchaeota archaeon]|nr:CBS domain-containing protein [Candidatus Aenigmarchaeota archaeon]